MLLTFLHGVFGPPAPTYLPIPTMYWRKLATRVESNDTHGSRVVAMFMRAQIYTRMTSSPHGSARYLRCGSITTWRAIHTRPAQIYCTRALKCPIPLKCNQGLALEPWQPAHYAAINADSPEPHVSFPLTA